VAGKGFQGQLKLEIQVVFGCKGPVEKVRLSGAGVLESRRLAKTPTYDNPVEK